jgi:hypothetical protein
MVMRQYFPIHSFVGASSSSNAGRTGSGGVGLLGANAKSLVNTTVNQYYTPQKRADKDDDADTASMGSVSERVPDSDEEMSTTDEDAPKKKKGKHTNDDALQSRKVAKKLNKKLEKDSPAGTNIQIHIKIIYNN